MQEIISALETIEKSLKTGNDPSAVQAAIKTARNKTVSSTDEQLQQLAAELLTWESKFPVIWREPAGRQGMAKHAKHWIEKLGRFGDRSSELGEKK